MRQIPWREVTAKNGTYFDMSKFEDACDAIARLAGDGKHWDMKDLVDETVRETTVHPQHAAMAVRALVRCGFLKAYHGGRSLENIRVNDNGGIGPEQLKPLMDKLEGLKSEAAAATKRAEKAEQAEKDAREKAQSANSVLEVRAVLPDGTVKVTKGIFHKKFKTILDLAAARKNIFVYGPTGPGKSYICKQLADTLNLPFAFIQCTSGMSEGQLGGRLLPIGDDGSFKYVASEFVKCYEEGGVFLLDEIDAADPNVLLLVNTALANGKMAIPNRPEKPYATRHKDFICIAAANTVGFGADRLYSGRNKLDAATLDRFQIGKVALDYDENVDRYLCPDDTLRTRLQRYRLAVLTHKLERAVSSRFMQDAYDMKVRAGWTDAQVDEALFAGWKRDEIEKVKTFQRTV